VQKLAACEPVYEEHPGWLTPTHEARTWNDLPEKARAYLQRLAELTGAKLVIASVGPNREQTIVL
jgi:adenylosuccinate synthase